MTPEEYSAKSAYQGDVASNYDAARMVEPLWEIEQTFVKNWTDSIITGSSILDIPAGTGRFIETFLAKGLEVKAMDISQDMLAQIMRRHDKTSGSLAISVADAERLPLENRSVDYVVSWRFFHLLPLKTAQAVLAEFHRVARKQIVIQVLPVRLGGISSYVPAAVKKLLRPLRTLLLRKENLPWSHIESFVHSERSMRALFRAEGLRLTSAVTIGQYKGFPVRVYTLSV